MRCAFTLVEMLATAAMTALLFITALSVSSGLLRQQRAADALGKATTPPALVELLRWDLINSREMKNYRRGIELEGFGALDQRTLAPTCLGPTRVVYDVEKIDQQSWLMRRQFRAGVWSTELVCPHVLNMTVEQIAVQEKSPASQPSTQPSAPKAVRLVINWDESDRARFDQDVILR